MAGPPFNLTRKELAEFLTDHRSIRAFEQLFGLIPAELDNLLLLVEQALLAANQNNAKITSIQQKAFELEVEQVSTNNNESKIKSLEKRIFELEVDLARIHKGRNLDALTKRIDKLEILQTLE